MSLGLVILLLIVVVSLSRLNPYLVSIAIAGFVGWVITSFFVKFGAPSWVIPVGIAFWIFATAPTICGILMSVIPPRKRQ